jgi:hypothetical protein
MTKQGRYRYYSIHTGKAIILTDEWSFVCVDTEGNNYFERKK